MPTKETKYFKTALWNLQVHFEVHNERFITLISELISILNFHRMVWRTDWSCLLQPEWCALFSNLVDSVGHLPVLAKKQAIGCSAKFWS